MLSLIGYNFCSDRNALDPMSTFLTRIVDTKIQNGIFDHLNISMDTTFDYSTAKPTDWNFETIIDCNFNGNINAGNLEDLTADITQVKIKRRIKGEFDWVTLKVVDINSPEDFIFTFQDNTAQNDTIYEYAYVPVMGNTESTNIEGEYNIEEILSKFNGVFVCDVNTIIKFYTNVEYGSLDQVHKVGTYEVLGRQYPIVVSNGLINYKKGTFNGDILPPDFMQNRTFNQSMRNAIVKQKDVVLNFLNNKQAKVLKDWNGNSWLIYITGNPSVTFANGSGMGWLNVSADWVEIGDVNDAKDLCDAGIAAEEV